MSAVDPTPSATLARFASTLTFDHVPSPVLRRVEDLFLDWFGSALAGKGARAVEAIERFARAMGPDEGPAEVLLSRRGTTPLFAAMVNAAASHVAEQDDVHNGSVFHPGAVVFPPALAVAQALGSSGRDLLTAVVAGYEVGIRVGEFLGRSHYKFFNTTGTAGTVAAAAAVGRLLGLSAEAMQHALGSAGTQAAGLWEFRRDAADSKQLHTAKAASDGIVANDLAPDRIARVTAHVHQAAIDVLGPVTAPATVHQAKFSMGTVLAMIARHRRAGLQEFARHFDDPDVAAFRGRVRMVRDADVEAAYPQRWIGKVEVETTDGRVLAARVDEPKGDPGNTLTRAEIEAKAIRLAEFGGGATAAEVHAVAATIFAVADVPHIGRLLADSSTTITPSPTVATP